VLLQRVLVRCAEENVDGLVVGERVQGKRRMSRSRRRRSRSRRRSRRSCRRSCRRRCAGVGAIAATIAP
jgi:hypothetical protein